MFEKTSDIKDKSEYQKIMKDYSNNYGFNFGINTMTNKILKDKFDNIGNKELSIKKR